MIYPLIPVISPILVTLVNLQARGEFSNLAMAHLGYPKGKDKRSVAGYLCIYIYHYIPSGKLT